MMLDLSTFGFFGNPSWHAVDPGAMQASPIAKLPELGYPEARAPQRIRADPSATLDLPLLIKIHVQNHELDLLIQNPRMPLHRTQIRREVASPPMLLGLIRNPNARMVTASRREMTIRND